MGNANESKLHYPFGDSLPATGTAIEVASGVRWLRMALPFALDHINLWLLRDAIDGRDGWSVVDCGIDNPGTRAAWEAVFANHLDGLPVLRVIVTHMHPDHMGLAHWLTEKWGVRLWMSNTDFYAARLACLPANDDKAGSGVGHNDAVTFFASNGLIDAAALAKVRERNDTYAGMVPQVPRQFRRLLDGQAVRIGDDDWRCVVGYGHAPEHIALHCEAKNVLIAGDMLLPRISTNISVYELEPEADPLPLFLASIDRLTALPPSTLVLPSHGKPFTGLQERVRQLAEHHRDRLADVMELCATAPRSAFDLLDVLFQRKLDLHQTPFAMGEAVAHVHALWHQGLLRRQRGNDGVYRFSVGLPAGATST